MELRDYARMVRRGWVTIVALTLLGVGVAAFYLVLAPKEYGSSTTLYVTASTPQSITDLQQGASFAGTAVITYAQIIDSGTVLAPAGAELRPQQTTDDLIGAVNASVREDTTLIDISTTAGDPRSAAVVANAVATTAARILPTLQLGPDGAPLVRVQQIRPAVEPTAASSPNVQRILAVGLVVGLLLGLGGTIVAQSLDTRLRRSEDIAPLTGVPLVAVVPGAGADPKDGLVARVAPSSRAGEAYRTLRTNLGSVTARTPASIVFAAVSASRNAAQVPANLAWALAASDRRVLLIDADMRASAIGDLLGIEPGSGLAEALSSHEAQPVTHRTAESQLRVMLSGTTATAPSDILSTPAFERLLRRLEQEYDTVVMHLPPVLQYADAAVVATITGGTFVTVDAGRTRSTELTTALEALANVRVRPLGIVLTGAGRRDQPTTSGGGTPHVAPSGALDTPTLRQQPVRPPPRPRYDDPPRRAATNPPWPV